MSVGITNFRTPQSIVFGKGAFERIGEEAKSRGEKALIISDKVMESLGFVKRCIDSLAHQGITARIYLGVDTEPTDLYVTEALDLFITEKCDILISLGGGSCIDTAKAVSVIASNGGVIGDYAGAGGKVALLQPIPHIAIPTTAGTGSEATDVTVITNAVTDVKLMVKQPAFMPTAAIVDPLLTITSPPHITAATGVDALSHAVEAYLSKKANPISDTLSLSAMKLIVANLFRAYEDGENLEAREAMALGALQAGMAFSNASVCLVHGLSRPIGALFHVPHGFSNAMLLPAVLEFSKNHCADRLADLGRFFAPEKTALPKETLSNLAVESVKNLCLQLKIPNLKDWGINHANFTASIDKMAQDALDSGSPANNPRVPTKQEIKDLYRICYDYDFTVKSFI
jgi:alcohol dehydrogenase class IV